MSVLWNIRVLHNNYLIIKYLAFLFCFLCFFRKGDSNFLKIHPLLLTIPITVTSCLFTHHSQTPSYPLLFLFPPPEPLSVLHIVMLSQSPWPLDTVSLPENFILTPNCECFFEWLFLPQKFSTDVPQVILNNFYFLIIKYTKYQVLSDSYQLQCVFPLAASLLYYITL